MSSTLKWLWLIICPLFLGNTHQYDVAPIAIHSVLLWRAAEQADNCMCQIIQSLPAPPRPTILWLTLCTCVSLPLPVFWVLRFISVILIQSPIVVCVDSLAVHYFTSLTRCLCLWLIFWEPILVNGQSLDLHVGLVGGHSNGHTFPGTFTWVFNKWKSS